MTINHLRNVYNISHKKPGAIIVHSILVVKMCFTFWNLKQQIYMIWECLNKDAGSLQRTVYTVILEGHKFRRFHCKFAEREILILEKK